MASSRKPPSAGMTPNSLMLITLAAIAPIAAYGQTKTQNVNVVNPTTNPVKTTITNTVVPVEVRNVDPIRATIQSLQGEIVRAAQTRTYSAGQSGSCFNPGITVPSGKILIVEQVSFRGQYVSGDQPTGFQRVALVAGSTVMDIAPQEQYALSAAMSASLRAPAYTK